MLINGQPRHPQSQGSVEKGNTTLKNVLISWMRDNKMTNWTKGLFSTQWAMNTTVSEATKVIPYKAVFGIKPRVGLRTTLSSEFLQNIEPGVYEEEFENFFSNNQDIPALVNASSIDLER